MDIFKICDALMHIYEKLYLFVDPKKIQKAQIIKFKWNLFAIIFAKNSSIYKVNNFEDNIR